MELSVVIINYNTKNLTAQTVRSVLDTAKSMSFEVIVVDNSNDENEWFQDNDLRVRTLRSGENRGFGHACNLGAAEAAGECLLFLNSDTIVGEQAVDGSLLYLKEHEGVGALGIRTLLPDGTLDHGCRRGFPTPAASFYYFTGMDKQHPESKKYGAYRQTFLPEDETAETDCVSGAFLMMPKRVFDETGGFDEMFFMYGEDVDLCYRVKQLGYRVVYYAGASIVHLKGASGLHTKSKKVIRCFYDSMKIFYRKHYRKKYNVFVTMAVYAAINLKYFLTLCKMKLKKS